MPDVRLIDANALESSLFQRTQNIAKEHLNGALEKPYAYLDCAMSKALIDWLEKAPTIDAVPVVHGRWIRAKDEQAYFDVEYVCSACQFAVAVSGIGTPILYGYKFCPNCGAKMDAKE